MDMLFGSVNNIGDLDFVSNFLFLFRPFFTNRHVHVLPHLGQRDVVHLLSEFKTNFRSNSVPFLYYSSDSRFVLLEPTPT